MSLLPTHFHGIPADELHAACLALGLTMKAKASIVMSMARLQQQQAIDAANAANAAKSGEPEEEVTSDEHPPPPPPPAAPASADENFFVTMHPAITLRPITSCPAKQFEDLQNKQPLWNVLIDMLARHPTFLSEVLADTAASDEGFTGKMLAMYKELYLGAGGRAVCYQPNMLGIFRNDYMEEVTAVATPATYEHSASWKQVEINTISVSFAGLAPKVGRFHQLVGQIAKNEVARRHPTALAPEERIHIGESDKVVPGALASGARQYLSWRSETVNVTPTSAVDPATYIPVVCFVIQENERNTTDQYMLSLEVEQTHSIRCIRRTLREINESLALVELPPLKEDGNPKVPPLAIIDGTYEVTLFYFRSCYTPTDFPTEVQWQARHDIEVSAAIKCPSLPYYLCTFKKVQQVITGSRMRSEGTALPAHGSNSPSARSPTSSMVKEFALPATPTSEVDHVQKLLSRIQLGAGAPSDECGPTGRRRGAPRKPFAVSAAQFYEAANAYADLDQTPSKTRASDAPGAFGLTYFSDGGSAVEESQVGWYTNWIRCNFVPIYSLNPRENPNAEDVISDAIANPRNYVLKPQLEGGGNLYSGDEMVTLLRVQKPEGDEAALSEAQKEFLKTYWRVRNEYILMRRIMVKKHSCDEVMSSAARSVTGSVTGSVDSIPPLGETPSVSILDDDASPLFRMGQIISKSQVRSACIGINHVPNDDLCSELGIYGVILSQGEAPSGSTTSTTNTDGPFSSVVAPTKVNILLNDSAGYVIRSKLASVDDGGVMAGAAFLDSIALRHSAAVAV